MVGNVFRRKRRLRSSLRNGVTIVELLVSVAVLVVIMSLVTTIGFRVQQLWKDIRHQQIAVGELSNQLEVLTQLDAEKVQERLAKLEPSSICNQTLREPEITGALTDDALGKRITLSINWKRRFPAKAIQLHGWINPQFGPPESEKSP